MDSDTAVRLLADTLITAIKIGAPVLVVTLAVGLLVSILQVVTQIQEMTLTFIPKLIAVTAIMLLLGSWMLSLAKELAIRMFEFAGSL